MLPSTFYIRQLYAPAKFEIATPNSLRGDEFTRKLTSYLKHDSVEYPLHHMAYAPAKV